MPAEKANTLCRSFLAQASGGHHEAAYVFLGPDLEPTDTLTFEALGRCAGQIARKLRACLRPGDRVILAFSNNSEAVQLFWGCILAGAIPIPAPAPERKTLAAGPSRLASIATDANVALGMASAGQIDIAREQVPGVPWLTLSTLCDTNEEGTRSAIEEETVDPSAVAYLQYTSGSTSAPRGVEITHANVLAQCEAFARHADAGRSRGLVWLPWFHDYGLVQGLIVPLVLGCTSYLMPTSHFLMRPLRWFEAVARYRITHIGAPDFAYQACVQALSRSPGWSANLDSLKVATCGAEPVRASTLNAFLDAFAPHGLHRDALAPSYGLAEAVLAVSVRDAGLELLQVAFDGPCIERLQVAPVADGTPGARTLVGCGIALPELQIAIVDPDTTVPCAPGHIGEIWVSGPSVARGYWRQAEASAGCFGAKLAAQGADGPPYLRTGDLGFIHRGQLFVAGRRKDLIIIGGRNLYPQDLELTAEAAHANIRRGGVMAVSVDSGARESVVLLVECNRRLAPEAVRELLDGVRANVALEHQVDLNDIVPLRAGTLPRTSSGKPQRSAAKRLYLQGLLEPLRLESKPPAPGELVPDQQAEGAPIDQMAQLWSEVLGVPVVDPDANFFHLGGDSLLATQVVSRLRARLGVELPISSLFETPTVRGLATRVARSAALPGASEGPTTPALIAPLVPRVPGTPVTLSYSQERMWFMHELTPDSGAYNIPLAIRFRGSFDIPSMAAALTRVVERHEVLRTRFLKTPQGLTGEVVEASPITIGVVELDHGMSPSSANLHHHLAARTLAPFRLDQPPLLRAEAIRTGASEWVLLIVMHHIIGDQWSFVELGRELAAHYNAVRRGAETPLPALPFQYADHAHWHRQWFEGERRARECAHWLHLLQGLSPLPLNEDFVRPRVQSFRGAAVRIPVSPSDVAAWRQLGTAEGASVSMVLMAALKILLHRHTGKSDIAIGVPIANRHHLSAEHLLGTFVNTLVLRTDLSGDPYARTVIARVRHVSLDAFSHQDMPFEVLVRELGERPDASRSPAFNVMFNMVNSPVRDCLFDGLEWSRVDFDRQSTQFDLTFVADLQFDQSIVIEYATDLFARETVERMGEHLQRILRFMSHAPNATVATIPLISGLEQVRLGEWSAGPQCPLPFHTVTEWVAQGARRNPAREALVFGPCRLTHQGLDEASNRLARWLRGRGATRGTRVGICLPRGSDLVVAMLAVLKTGAAYVPLDPSYPVQRTDHQIADADLLLLITHASIASQRQWTGADRVLLDGERSAFDAMSAAPIEPDSNRDARPEDPAYLIYTSGSTGLPKGVAVPHRAVVNLLSSMASRPGFSSADRLLAVTTASFDIAVLELLLPLGAGGAVVVAADDQAGDGRALAGLIQGEAVTVLQATPSRWHLLIDSGWRGDPHLKALVGGEPLTLNLASQLRARCGEVWNMYGPTETTVWSSCWRVPDGVTQTISLGQPVNNTSIEVLDSNLQPCPIGVPGEICIGGLGVALGYHRQDALTAERFVERPATAPDQGRRVYRTGDRARWRLDGTLEHLGRLDDQIKLRGFRVELGEIEASLLSHPGVARAVAMLREDTPGTPRLVAYVVPSGPMPTAEALRRHLRQRLPEHMVPPHFVELLQLPVLPNGKTDRRALPRPADGRPAKGGPLEQPRNAVEQVVWRAWRSALKTDHFGIHDNFFDLGGHSIQAVGVVNHIEKTLGQPCALRLVFEHPTVAELAAALQPANRTGTADLPLTLLQPEGDGPPLFLLAGAEMYRSLARQLAPHIPVYGVFSRTEIDLLETPATAPLPRVSIEALADEYLALIRTIQPHGPYFLGGFSIGGVLAYDVAQRLQRQGESLGLVILLDSLLPGWGWQHVLAGVRRRLRMLRQHGARHLKHILQVYLLQRSQRSQPGGRRNQAYAQAIRAYRAGRGDMPLLFLQAGDDASTAPAYGWQSLVPALTVARVPGRHADILEPPNVGELSGHVRAHLEATRPSWTEAGPANPVDADSNHRH